MMLELHEMEGLCDARIAIIDQIRGKLKNCCMIIIQLHKKSNRVEKDRHVAKLIEVRGVVAGRR